MGRILGFYLFPHPPVVIEEIGGEERLKAQQTITGVEKLSEDIEKKKTSDYYYNNTSRSHVF
jgi:hypothetical protein